MGNEKKFFGYKAAIGAFLIIFANTIFNPAKYKAPYNPFK